MDLQTKTLRLAKLWCTTKCQAAMDLLGFAKRRLVVSAKVYDEFVKVIIVVLVKCRFSEKYANVLIQAYLSVSSWLFSNDSAIRDILSSTYINMTGSLVCNLHLRSLYVPTPASSPSSFLSLSWYLPFVSCQFLDYTLSWAAFVHNHKSYCSTCANPLIWHVYRLYFFFVRDFSDKNLWHSRVGHLNHQMELVVAQDTFLISTLYLCDHCVVEESLEPSNPVSISDKNLWHCRTDHLNHQMELAVAYYYISKWLKTGILLYYMTLERSKLGGCLFKTFYCWIDFLAIGADWKGYFPMTCSPSTVLVLMLTNAAWKGFSLFLPDN